MRNLIKIIIIVCSFVICLEDIFASSIDEAREKGFKGIDRDQMGTWISEGEIKQIDLKNWAEQNNIQGGRKIVNENPDLFVEMSKYAKISSDENESETDDTNKLFDLTDSSNTESTLPPSIQPSTYGGGDDSWGMNNGSINTTGNGDRRLAFGDIDEEGNITPDTWKDYTLSADAILKSIDGEYGNGYGIYYRADGEDRITGYIFQYDPGLGNCFVVRKVTDGREASPFQRVKMNEIFPDNFQIADAVHNIEISVKGDNHVINVDGKEVFNFTDSWRDSGCAGLRAWHKSDVDFSNISVNKH